MTEKGSKPSVTVSSFLQVQPVLIAPTSTEAFRVGRRSPSGSELDTADDYDDDGGDYR